MKMAAGSDSARPFFVLAAYRQSQKSHDSKIIFPFAFIALGALQTSGRRVPVYSGHGGMKKILSRWNGSASKMRNEPNASAAPAPASANLAVAMQNIYEEFKVRASELVEQVKKYIHEGNVRRIIVKDEHGHTYLEIPLTIAAVGTIAAPVLAAVGALAALAAKFTVVVERAEREPDEAASGEH